MFLFSLSYDGCLPPVCGTGRVEYPSANAINITLTLCKFKTSLQYNLFSLSERDFELEVNAHKKEGEKKDTDPLKCSYKLNELTTHDHILDKDNGYHHHHISVQLSKSRMC